MKKILLNRVKNRSNDPKLKVGCLIIYNDFVIADGWNRFPKGIKEDERLYGKLKNDIIIHAEQDALNKCYNPVGASLMVTTHPCCRCAASIIDVGIEKVVCPPPRDNHEEKLASEMFKEAGIEVKYV